MRVVAALGGNAILRRGEPPEADAQRRNVELAATSLAELARSHELVVTHGNGPQVGLLALQAAATADIRPYPLDVLGAETEGMIGYLLEQAIENVLPGRIVATLLTQVVVDPGDPAFDRPTKPIGAVYTEARARELAAVCGWSIAPDGDRYRRVVASPEPLRIVELAAIRALLEAGAIVICAGGGGIPVAVGDDGGLHGVEAVIDKDLASALLAAAIGADRLLLLTDVEAVDLGWGGPVPSPLHVTTPMYLRRHGFAPGSMGPKVDAACRFVERTGGAAAIGSLREAAALLAGRAGTQIRPATAGRPRATPAH